MVRDWLKDVAPDAFLFPKLAKRRTWLMVKKDLEKAGIPYINSDGVADFHAAGRHSFITGLLRNGATLPEAMEQLSLRYGHFRQADTGVLDAFFERYQADNVRRPMPFFEWVETVYDPDELKRCFQASGWANRLVNRVLKRE